MTGACCSCEEIEKMIESSLAKAPTRMKTKRAPSAYNLHMKVCIPGKSGPITERFKACALEYKTVKEAERRRVATSG